MLTQKKRPKLKIEHTPFDKLSEAVGWCVLFAIWIGIIISYDKLPETIPTHYNAQGVIDGYGNKSSIWMLMLSFCYFGIIKSLQKITNNQFV